MFVSYAQNFEDVMLWRALKDVSDGFYIDVGAGWPEMHSVTKTFYDRGWRGINLEPNPELQRLLADARPRDINLGVALSDRGGRQEFYVISGTGLSSLDRDVATLHEAAGFRSENCHVEVSTLSDVWREHVGSRQVHFLKVDAEGTEQQVLSGNDWSQNRPWILVVEATMPMTQVASHESWESIVLGSKYVLAYNDGLNRFYVAEEHSELLSAFSLPPNAFDGFVLADQLAAETRARAATDAANTAEARERTAEERIRHSEQRAAAAVARSQAAENLAHDANAQVQLMEARADQAEMMAVAAKHQLHLSRLQAAKARSAAREAKSRLTKLKATISWRGTRPLRKIAKWPQRLRIFLSVLRRYHQAVLYRRVSRFSGVKELSGLPISEWLFGSIAARLSARGRAARRKFTPPLQGQRNLVQLAELLGEPGRLPERRQIAALSAALRSIDRHSEDSLARRAFSPAERAALLELEYALHVAQESPWFCQEGPPMPRSEDGGRTILVFDARCLQDANFRHRGIGLHARHVLATLRNAAEISAQIVLLLDPTMGPVDDEIAALADRCAFSCAEINLSLVKLFVCASPMTASLGPIAPLLLAPHIRRAVVVYDFIPARFARQYLRSASDCITYHARYMALPLYHSFLPISKATAEELSGRLPFVDPARILASGIADPLDAASATGPEASPNLPQRYIVAPTGGDARKNLLVVIAGEALNRQLGEEANHIVVVGDLAPAHQRAALKLARQSGLSRSEIFFLSHLPAGDLRSIYARARLCVVPSFAEGFSIPVAESVRSQTPVVASDIPSHRELLGAGPWLASPSSAIDMARAMRTVIRKRESILQAQRHNLGDRADPLAVSERIAAVQNRLLTTVAADGPGVVHGQKGGRPRIAVATPWPPDRSGVADYSSHTLARVADLVDVTILTNTESIGEPRTDRGSLTFRVIGAAAYLDPQYDCVLTVLGNSHFHLPAFEYVMDLGGPVLAHDNRMIEFYWHLLGPHRAAKVLSSAGRQLAASDLEDVLLDLDNSPSTAYREIGRVAEPLLVHSKTLQERLSRETSARVERLQFVPYRLPQTGAVEAHARLEAKRRRALKNNVINIATFGIQDRRTKGADLLVDAMAWLELWDIPALLHVVGAVPQREREELERTASERAVGHRIIYHDHVSQSEYSEMLLAADVAVQLRMSSILTLSGALLDCIAFGVPTVVTQSMIDEISAPGYVTAIPDRISPLLIAEALVSSARLRDANLEKIESQRRGYLAENLASQYAGKLLAALHLAPGTIQ